MFRHPASATLRTYGCGCGCNSCGGKTPSYAGYGFTVSAGLPWAAKWDYAKEAKDLTIACPDFDKAVEEYLKAKERFDDTGSVFGIRVGGEKSRVDAAVDAMKKWKGRGKAALTKCRNREIDTPLGGQQGPTQKEYQRIIEDITRPAGGGGGREKISGGGASRFGEGTNPLVYVIGASVVGLVGIGAVALWKKSQREEAAA